MDDYQMIYNILKQRNINTLGTLLPYARFLRNVFASQSWHSFLHSQLKKEPRLIRNRIRHRITLFQYLARGDDHETT